MDFAGMEKKWGERWEKERAFEASPGEREKFYLTAAFPYPNSPQHIGHARTYTTTDVYARYMRMNGKNVLFPMAFHVTGTPVLAMAKRIAAKDGEIVEIFRDIYKIPEGKIAELNTPEALVRYFSSEIEQGMKDIGFSIDWRRKFYSNDVMFNKFIEWQFRKLKENNYITSGTHPVPWCPSCNNAVGAHDTQGDIDPEIGEYVAIKFSFEDGSLLTATFRPETLYGVTNVWANPDVSYVKAKVQGEIFYISREAAQKFAMQARKVEIVGEVSGKALLGKICTNPLTGEKVSILPASFASPENGSGIVMSVPAHAPYDCLALRDLKGSAWEGKALPMRQVLKIEGFGEFPAVEIVDRMGVKSQNDAKAEEATAEIYSKEAHTGVMVAGDYRGERVIAAKERIKGDLVRANKATTMFEIVNGPVRCRCGALCGVKIVENQWFINYGDGEWKEKTQECFDGMRLIPEKTRSEYGYTIGWLKERACARASGLGTRFPFDRNLIIESLSDSTVYMAFYTIAHLLKKIDAEKLDDGFFDFVFLGKGSAGDVAKKAGADAKLVEEMRREFLYWYPLDSRHSAGDLIHNHLTFFVFNHVAVFPREHWPRGIVTNGFVLMEGKKMSKSMGNILPLREAIANYGSDVVRFSVISGAELAQDSDFTKSLAEGVGGKLKWAASLIEESAGYGEEGKKPIDGWLLSRLHRRIERSTELFKELDIRGISQDVFYNSLNDLRWYARRGEKNKSTLAEFFENWLLLMAPFTPFFAEEMWERLGKKEFISRAGWPAARKERMDELAELAEKVVIGTMEDVGNVLKIVKEKKAKAFIYCAMPWKRKLYGIAREEKRFESAMKIAVQNAEMKGKDVAGVLKRLLKNVNELEKTVLSFEGEHGALAEAAEFYSKEFGMEVSVLPEDRAQATHAEKASRALPMKPSIYLE